MLKPCASCRTPARPGPCPSCGILVVGMLLAGPAFAGDPGPTGVEARTESAQVEPTRVEPMYGVPATPEEDRGFSPDRPGIGESTGTVAPGHGMVEAGVGLATAPVAFGTAGIMGRIGVARFVEARVRVPDLAVTDEVAVGATGLGAKLAVATDEVGFSLVPELAYHLGAGALGGSLGANVTVAAGRFGLWGHGTLAAFQESELSLVVGGGASVSLGRGGGYLNAGATPLAGGGFVGGGAWIALGSSGQLDAGMDFQLGEPVVPVLGLGGSVLF